MPRASFSVQSYQQARDGLRDALRAGWAMLGKGGLARKSHTEGCIGALNLR